WTHRVQRRILRSRWAGRRQWLRRVYYGQRRILRLYGADQRLHLLVDGIDLGNRCTLCLDEAIHLEIVLRRLGSGDLLLRLLQPVLVVRCFGIEALFPEILDSGVELLEV